MLLFLLLLLTFSLEGTHIVDWRDLPSKDGEEITIHGFVDKKGTVLTNRLQIPSCCADKPNMRKEIRLIDPPALEEGAPVALSGRLRAGDDQTLSLIQPVKIETIKFKAFYLIPLLALPPFWAYFRKRYAKKGLKIGTTTVPPPLE